MFVDIVCRCCVLMLFAVECLLRVVRCVFVSCLCFVDLLFWERIVVVSLL